MSVEPRLPDGAVQLLLVVQVRPGAVTGVAVDADLPALRDCLEATIRTMQEPSSTQDGRTPSDSAASAVRGEGRTNMSQPTGSKTADWAKGKVKL